ncbi:sodium-coupled monocarboxylate transporter 2-like [Scaptodrosophila lebanonensis]|uniref:Sodium-coupled monocarboxylate transporter 2-like n=1 Tax=Drosophila lebanonensis TaxID=7225 RepID=A0A6J2TXS6_DROLE|nr:sodium-coupled monocarboxylate transporter 2-like [Scaptodrosophila lebanonensis]
MKSESGTDTSPLGLNFGITDYVVFTILLSSSAAIGVYFGFFAKVKNTTEEYLQGGKKMKTLPIAISLITSQLSGIAIMSIPAETYSFGFNFIFVALAMIAAIPILIYAIIPVFYENKVSNCYEYLEMRFSKGTRQLVTGIFVGSTFLMLPVYMFIPALAFSQVSGINIHLINTMVSSICVFYTMLGGIKAVVWTDVVQGGIMLLSIVLVSALGTLRTGGVGTVMEYASEGGRLNFDFRLDPRIRITVWSAFSSGLLIWIGSIGMDQSCLQRIVSLPTYVQAKKSLMLTCIGFVIIMFFNAFTGIIMFAHFFGCDPMLAGLVNKADKMMPFFVQDTAGHITGMPGVFISCVFSAALSTLSGYLHSFAGVVYFDYVKPHIRHTEERANTIMRLLVIAMGIYCIVGGFIVERFDSIMQTMMTISSVTSGPVMSVFVLGMFVPRVGSKAAITGILFSITVMTSIIVKSQLSFQAGHIKYVPLPTSIDQCEVRNVSIILNVIRSASNTTTTASPFPDKPPLVTNAFSSNRQFSIFEISFYWYRLLGVLLVFLWAIPMSYVWTPDKMRKQSPKLFSPFVRKFLPEPEIMKEAEGLPLRDTIPNEATKLEVEISEMEEKAERKNNKCYL